jgi:hypothetical protein
VRGCPYACVDCVGNVAPTALKILPRIRDQDLGPGVLVQPLLDAAVVSALLWGNALLGTGFLFVVVVVDIAHVPLGVVVRRVRRGR